MIRLLYELYNYFFSRRTSLKELGKNSDYVTKLKIGLKKKKMRGYRLFFLSENLRNIVWLLFKNIEAIWETVNALLYFRRENKRKCVFGICTRGRIESSRLGRNRYSTPLCNESQAATMKKTNVPGHKEAWFSVSLKIETTVTPAPLIYPFLINQNKCISCL